MSSQTQPQKVQVAFSITLSSMKDLSKNCFWLSRNKEVLDQESQSVDEAVASDSLSLPSRPDDGTVNVQPSARPWQLPRTRLGMNRPGSTCSHAASSDASSGKEKCGELGPLISFLFMALCSHSIKGQACSAVDI